MTVLVGPNNAGKSALAKGIHLLAGGLIPSNKDSREPLPLESGGIRHGETFEDLVTGRAVHGGLRLSAELAGDGGNLSLSATVQNVVAPSRASERRITEWSLCYGSDRIGVTTQGLDRHSPYSISASGPQGRPQQVRWQGLIPRHPTQLSTFASAQVDALRAWAGGIRYLQCPRRLHPSPFALADHPTALLGPTGWNAPQALATEGVGPPVVSQRSRSEYRCRAAGPLL